MVNIPLEHMEVVNKTSIFIQQFSLFMNGENSSIIIRNEEEYSNAAVVIKSVKDHKKLIVASKESVVTPLYDTYKEHLAVFTEKVDTVDEKIKALEDAGRAFRKLDDERKAKEQLLENQRAAKAKADAEKLLEKANEKATEYETNGRSDKAEEWRGKAAVAEIVANNTVPNIVSSNIPKNTRGSFNTKTYYAAEIFNYQQLIDSLKDELPKGVKESLQTYVNAQARTSDGAESKIPGVRFYAK